MDFSIDISNINMEAPIQDKSLPIKDIKDFPSKQAEAIQKHLLELDKQGKLKEEFLNRYGNNLGKPSSLANYILEDFENRKKLFIEWTGLETFDDKHTVVAIDIKLNEVSKGNGKYFLWKCKKCGHGWVSNISNRTNNGQGCPACAGKICIPGVNDLETWCRQQAAYGAKIKSEFIGLDENNKPIKINEVSKASNIKVWWKCSNPDCNYKWTAKVNSRTCKNSGCPACSLVVNRLISGVNDLETYCKKQHPELKYILDEFIGKDADENELKPSEISSKNMKDIYWECRHCHKRWLASPLNRIKHNSGCPYCAAGNQTSFPEQYIYHSLKQLFPDILNRAKDPIKNYEYDITIPSLKLCIEYSGYGWHKNNIEHDIEKEVHCKSHNVQFLQIYSHYGEIKDTDGNIAQDTYTPNQIIYKVNNDKTLHIIQLQHIIEYILKEYSPNHSITEIGFELAEHQANEVMGKA